MNLNLMCFSIKWLLEAKKTEFLKYDNFDKPNSIAIDSISILENKFIDIKL